MEILESMQTVCEILDQADINKPYSAALEKQKTVVNNPNLTSSAILLARMTKYEQPYSCFALNTSREHAQTIKSQTLDSAVHQEFTEMASKSIAKQQEIEQKPQVPFEQFLQDYFSQT